MICYPCETNNHENCRVPDCECDGHTEAVDAERTKALKLAIGLVAHLEIMSAAECIIPVINENGSYEITTKKIS